MPILGLAVQGRPSPGGYANGIDMFGKYKKQKKTHLVIGATQPSPPTM
jgi:hypothetical protein